MAEPILSIENLNVSFRNGSGWREVISGVSLDVRAGEVIGVVGESGSGKSVTAMAVMRLLGEQGKITGGRIRYEGTDLIAAKEQTMRDLRGKAMAMVFQEPMTSLNPLLKVGYQISEVLAEKRGMTRSAARSMVVEMLARVGIPSPSARFNEYPNTLSGGMRQRVMIAMAMICRPRLLLADEPTTALDVTIQAQILDLMTSIREEEGTGILLITHDMGVIARMAERVVVMYAGEVVEAAPIAAIVGNPAHPYTRLLMAATPSVKRKAGTLRPIPGIMPSPGALPSGCRFHPRCPLAIDQCRVEHPVLLPSTTDHLARCHRSDDMRKGVLA